MSSIRSARDKRYTPRHWRERRETTNERTHQKIYDTELSLKSSSSEPPFLTGEYSRTDHKIDHTRMIGEVMVDRIETMSANAILTDRRAFYYFRRKQTGRRCSCYLYDTSPDAKCHVCLGTGIVGGFDKHSTNTETLDYTTPGLTLVNIEPNYDEDSRPIFFRLKEGCASGFIEAVVPIKQNVGTTDTMMLYQPIFSRQNKITFTSPTSVVKEITKPSDINEFLAFPEVRVRIEMLAGDVKPYTSHFMFRYNIHDKPVVFVDIPRAQDENQTLGNLGFIEFYQELEVFFDAKQIRNVRPEDIIYRIRDGKRFKLVSVKDNWIMDRLTSVDTTARYLIPDTDFGGMNILI